VGVSFFWGGIVLLFVGGIMGGDFENASLFMNMGGFNVG